MKHNEMKLIVTSCLINLKVRLKNLDFKNRKIFIKEMIKVLQKWSKEDEERVKYKRIQKSYYWFCKYALKNKKN